MACSHAQLKYAKKRYERIKADPVLWAAHQERLRALHERRKNDPDYKARRVRDQLRYQKKYPEKHRAQKAKQYYRDPEVTRAKKKAYRQRDPEKWRALKRAANAAKTARPATQLQTAQRLVKLAEIRAREEKMGITRKEAA
jgi:hypothetical protein